MAAVSRRRTSTSAPRLVSALSFPRSCRLGCVFDCSSPDWLGNGLGTLMARLINSELASARQDQCRERSPFLILDRAARDADRLHFGNESLDVVAHQIQLVDAVLGGGMDGNFRRRESENEPTLADIDTRQSEHILEKTPISLGVSAVDNGMRTDEHDNSSPPILEITAIDPPPT